MAAHSNSGDNSPGNPRRPLSLQPGDSYWDGPHLVFTRQYHLRRGYCCGSGCRHCPYQPSATTTPDQRQRPHGIKGT
jgi:hypothetical protein